MLHMLPRKQIVPIWLRIPIYRLYKPIFQTTAMFFCMRAELILRASPMATALMAAGIAAGENPAFLAAGCLLGMLRIPLSQAALLPAIGCVLVLVTELLLSFLHPKKRMQGDAKYALIAGICVLLPTLLRAKGVLLPSLQALSCAFLAAASVPFFTAALAVHPGRERLMLQEKLGFVLLAGIALAGMWHRLPTAGQFVTALLPLGGWMLGVGGRASSERWNPNHIVSEARDETKRRLQALGDAFSEMAEECSAPGSPPDEQTLICEMRSRLCAGCTGYEHCWAGADNCAVRLLCQLITDALDRVDAPPGMRVIFSDGEIPLFVLQICRRGHMIPDRLGLLLRDFAEKRRSEIKRCANNQLMAAQFMQAREILYHLAERQSEPASFRGMRLEQMRGALDSVNLGDSDVMIYGTDEAEVHLFRSEGWGREEVRGATLALSRAFGGKFRPELYGERLRFIRRPRLRVDTGASCQSGVAGEMCGDSHLIRMMEGNRLLLVLSDGMGSGNDASRESTEALRLLWCFLSAGISRTLALETVNQRLLMKSADEMFATVDLCILDLNTGVAEFSKFAACRTLILRGREILQVEGGRLPLGILEGVQPKVCRMRLRPGDLLVMGSDGVMEAGDTLMIERLTREHAARSPEQLAEMLVREASLSRAQGRQDDLTCICMRVQAAG